MSISSSSSIVIGLSGPPNAEADDIVTSSEPPNERPDAAVEGAIWQSAFSMAYDVGVDEGCPWQWMGVELS